MIRLKKYRDFAREAHRGQVRRGSGDPYHYHVERVAAIVASIPSATEIEIGAALLHDVVEDTDIPLELIEISFPARVARIVDDLTNRYTSEAYPDKNRAERKEAEFARLRGMGIWVRRIKAADRLDNLLEMDPADPFSRVYAEESRLLVDALGEFDDDYLSDLLHQILWQVREIVSG